jgi:hypothetical protein
MLFNINPNFEFIGFRMIVVVVEFSFLGIYRYIIGRGNVIDLFFGGEGTGSASRLQFLQRQLQPGGSRCIFCFIQVLAKTNLSKTFGQFATANYSFYTFVKERFIFLAMVESNVLLFPYSMR